MRRLAAFMLGGVPLCASTERAVTATLADWRHEAARAHTIAARAGITIRYAIALLRALGGSTLRQLPHELWSPFLRRLAAASILTIALVAWLNPAPAWAATSAADLAWLSLLQSVQVSLMFVLLVVFVSEATGRPARSGPSLATGLILAAALIVFRFVVAPEAINHVALRTWQEYTWAALADGRLPPVPSPIRLLTGGPTRDISLAYLVFPGLNWITLSVVAWAFSVLGYRVRQYAGQPGVNRHATVWGGILVVLILVVAARLLRVQSGPEVVSTFYLSHAAFVIGALATSSWLARRTPDVPVSSRRWS